MYVITCLRSRQDSLSVDRLVANSVITDRSMGSGPAGKAGCLQMHLDLISADVKENDVDEATNENQNFTHVSNLVKDMYRSQHEEIDRIEYGTNSDDPEMEITSPVTFQESPQHIQHNPTTVGILPYKVQSHHIPHFPKSGESIFPFQG